MMFGLFGNNKLLDDESILWMFDTYAWALKNFGSDVFYNETKLVLPTSEHFPGRENSVHSMAGLIFEQVKEHASLKHWPCRLEDESTCNVTVLPKLQVDGAIRGSKGVISNSVDDANKLLITYNSALVRQPEALIANYAHILAHYMGANAEERPPGGEENWPHITEVLAVFMGFGVMFANSALNLKINSCGSCQGPMADRNNFLSQYDITYALAIFSVLKNIPDKQVTRHLKSSLRGFYKKSVKDIKSRKEEVERLRIINSSIALIESTRESHVG